MKKIMFNDKCGLTKAVLVGRKTMTRRIVPNKTRINLEDFSEYQLYDRLNEEYYPKLAIERYSRYAIGEVVAVAQSYNDIYEELKRTHGSSSSVTRDFFRKYIQGGRMPVSNKMFVKSDAMIKQIKITDIKVERLQDITEEDCLREGVVNIGSLDGGPLYVPSMNMADVFECPQDAFAMLIDKVSGKGTWERNPWVFAYTFELVK